MIIADTEQENSCLSEYKLIQYKSVDDVYYSTFSILNMVKEWGGD
jgi:hypothetical protein